MISMDGTWFAGLDALDDAEVLASGLVLFAEEEKMRSC